LKRSLVGFAVQHAGQRIEFAVIEQSQVVFQNSQDGVDVINDARPQSRAAVDEQQTHEVAFRRDRQDGMIDPIGRGILHDLLRCRSANGAASAGQRAVQRLYLSGTMTRMLKQLYN
jgi:hypothetical protein